MAFFTVLKTWHVPAGHVLLSNIRRRLAQPSFPAFRIFSCGLSFWPQQPPKNQLRRFMSSVNTMWFSLGPPQSAIFTVGTSSELVVPMAADRWRCFLSKSVNKPRCPVSSQGNSETFCKQMQWPFAQRQKWRLKFNEAFRGGYWEQRRRTGQGGELGRSAQITCCENTINCYLDADWAKCY